MCLRQALWGGGRGGSLQVAALVELELRRGIGLGGIELGRLAKVGLTGAVAVEIEAGPWWSAGEMEGGEGGWGRPA